MNKVIFSEEWCRWEPISGLADKYCLVSVVSDEDGFKVILEDDKGIGPNVSIFFKDYVWSYRNVDENFRIKIIGDLLEKYGSSFYGQWTFFTVKESDYFNWLSEQSHEIFNANQFIHFSIVACDDILDIVSCYEPEVTFLEEIT